MGSKMRTIAQIMLVALALSSFSLSWAQIYKCTAPDGRVAYQDSPCNEVANQNTVNVPPPPSRSDQIAAQRRLDAIKENAARRRLERMQSEANRRHSIAENRDSDSADSPASPPSRSAPQQLSQSSNGCPEGTVHLNPSKLGGRGWSDSKGYVDLKCGMPGERDEPRRDNEVIHGALLNTIGDGNLAINGDTGEVCHRIGKGSMYSC